MQLQSPLPSRSSLAMERERSNRDLTKRPVRELVWLKWSVRAAVLGVLATGLMLVLTPCFAFPMRAWMAGGGCLAALVAFMGAVFLAAQPACKVVWGNHPRLNRMVHAWAPLGMLGWIGVFASMAISVTYGAPARFADLDTWSWAVFVPGMLLGFFGIACVSELLATVARAGQADDAAERLRFSFLALALCLLLCIPMWWSVLYTWGGPGMIIAVGASVLVIAVFARFASGFLPLLPLTTWAIRNAEDAIGHEARRAELQAQRVKVLSDEEIAAKEHKRDVGAQTEPWAKPVFKGSNTLKRDGETRG